METATNLTLIKTETAARPLQPIIEELNLKLSNFSESLIKFECDICSDSTSGMVTVEESGYKFARPCVCRLEKVRRKKLSIIPPMFADVSIDNIAPQPKKHAAQTEAIKLVKNNPTSNFLLGGRFGTGKTLLMYCLYREAVMRDRRTAIFTLSELLNEYRKFIQDSMSGVPPTPPRIVAEDLRQTHTQFSIFIDDIDKAKPTEYAAEQLFELADAIYAFNHQVVVTTNLTLPKLVDHFERADERFGGSIVRRLIETSIRIEMF